MDEHQTREHVHGTMDIRQHNKTFAGFIRLSAWGVGIAIAILVFMALTNS